MSTPDTSAPQILFVDDEPNAVKYFQRAVEKLAPVITASTVEEGKRLLDTNADSLAVLISDQRMPGMTGVDFLRRVKEIHPDCVRMMLSGYVDLKSVGDAINEGAIYKFLTKPWDNELLCSNIEEAFRSKEMVVDNKRLQEELRAANIELARVNDELRGHLRDKSQQAMRDEAALGAGLGDLGEVRDGLEPASGAGGLALAEGHVSSSSRTGRSGRRPPG